MYAAGLGASLEAEKLARAEKVGSKKAERFARRAVSYWGKYFRMNPREKYYFPYTMLAMAEAVLGESDKMDLTLRAAARLSGKKTSYWEFMEVRGLVKEI